MCSQFTQQIFRHNLLHHKGEDLPCNCSLPQDSACKVHFYRRCSLPTRQDTTNNNSFFKVFISVFFFIYYSIICQTGAKKTSAVILRNRRFTGITYQIRKSGSVMNHSINSTSIGKASPSCGHLYQRSALSLRE